MLSGVNVAATADLAKACGIPVIASGGVASIKDIEALLPMQSSGVCGSILGRAIYENTLSLIEATALVKRSAQL